MKYYIHQYKDVIIETDDTDWFRYTENFGSWSEWRKYGGWTDFWTEQTKTAFTEIPKEEVVLLIG